MALFSTERVICQDCAIFSEAPGNSVIATQQLETVAKYTPTSPGSLNSPSSGASPV
ncbi:hypothetical protein K4A83_00030 [Spirulina subsalsa FACHB-351]|uniref:Uncharacterized protein n=1 Tax=Spirulina subsalsa FACHB-351 TaxID=234711 RepID=A0ABT3KZI9_9CYAN|nr:hypothetical protein [Spirulina subsalsa]MCW6034665.1 hypothetical protein [Spirulina subsalsa FACHB-351]